MQLLETANNLEKAKRFSMAATVRGQVACKLLGAGFISEAATQFGIAGRALIRQCEENKKSGSGLDVIENCLKLARIYFADVRKLNVLLLTKSAIEIRRKPTDNEMEEIFKSVREDLLRL